MLYIILWYITLGVVELVGVCVTVVDVLLSCARCGACWVVERRGSVEVLRARVVFQMRSVIRSAHSGRVMD